MRASGSWLPLVALVLAGCAGGVRAPAPVDDRSAGSAAATSPAAPGGPVAPEEASGVVVRPLPSSSARLGEGGEGESTPSPEGTGAPGAAGPSGSPAVVALLGAAQRQEREGRDALAGASLERALRLEPRNPVLWHELARLRCQQDRYGECESLAARSNGLSAGPALQRENWALIATARLASGDSRGAAEARAAAARIGN